MKGVYLAQNADRTFWSRLGAVKLRDGFKLMWEIEAPWCHPYYMKDIQEICETYVDAFSINIQEAQLLFNCAGEEACIQNLQQLKVSFTLFRVGSKGLYVVTPDEAIMLSPAPGPVVDPTGCGNTSTGAALYAFGEGHDPLMIGIMANVGASMNIRQYGIIPNFKKIREEAFAMSKSLYEQYKKN